MLCVAASPRASTFVPRVSLTGPSISEDSSSITIRIFGSGVEIIRRGVAGLTAADVLEPDPNDTGCRDLGYWELYTRWVQYGVFLPMFRSHGTDAAREIWRFGEEGSPFYDTIARYIRLRYQLMPYIYSLAAHVTFGAYTLMRAVALEFPDDLATHNILDQYVFGPALLVCPVTEPMYYRSNSELIANAVEDPARIFAEWSSVVRLLDVMPCKKAEG